MPRVLLSFMAALALVLGGLAQPAGAQSPYSVIARVDEAAITAFEVDQRARFLAFIRAPGAGRSLALDQLIEDRLKLAAASRAGIGLTDEGLTNGLEEFAGRANLSADELIARLRSQGIEEGTFREFVRVGISWRELIRRRFGSRAQVSEDEIDRAQGQTRGGTRISVLLNEIILPARAEVPGEIETAQQNAQRLQEITSISRFQAEAARLSASASRQQSGRLNWLELSELPAPLRPVLLGLTPGEVTAPLQTDNALILFQLRDIREREGRGTSAAAIDYAALYLPTDSNRLSRIVGEIDTCDDLYGIAQGMPPEALERGSRAVEEIPEDVALELAKLDVGEISTALTRAGGQTRVLLMLCARVPNLEESEDGREAIRNELRSRRLNGFADGFLAELEAQAVIRRN